MVSGAIITYSISGDSMKGMESVVMGMVVVGSALMLFCAGGVLAAGGNLNVKVPGVASGSGAMSTQTGVLDSTITSKAKNDNAKAVATGEGARANVGHIGIRGGATVSGSTITDKSSNSGAKAVATGKDSEASVGGIDIQ